MMCGCCPRYWVMSRRASSRASSRSSASEQTMSCGRSTSSTRPAGALGARGEVLDRLLVVGRRDEVVQHDPVGDLAGELHHLHAGRADVDRHVLRAPLLVDVVELDPVEVDELAVEGDRLVGEERRAPR
jgi:hypothetical protein